MLKAIPSRHDTSRRLVCKTSLFSTEIDRAVSWLMHVGRMNMMHPNSWAHLEFVENVFLIRSTVGICAHVCTFTQITARSTKYFIYLNRYHQNDPVDKKKHVLVIHSAHSVSFQMQSAECFFFLINWGNIYWYFCVHSGLLLNILATTQITNNSKHT